MRRRPIGERAKWFSFGPELIVSKLISCTKIIPEKFGITIRDTKNVLRKLRKFGKILIDIFKYEESK